MLEIRNYDMDNTTDKLYIKEHLDEIWAILQTGYEEQGGFKGFQSRNDLLKKSPFLRLGYCNDSIVAVTVYNGYLGGEKCVGFTCVKNEQHETGVKLLELILEYNIVNWEQWIWIEASGKVEEMCKTLGAFNVPCDYAIIYLQNIPYEECDEYHYSRMIAGKKEVKTIFGFKDAETFDIIKNNLNKKVDEFLKKTQNKKGGLNENQSKKEEIYQQYLQKKGDCQRYKDIIDYFIYLHEDEGINELPIESLNILRSAVDSLQEIINSSHELTIDRKYLRLAIEEGNELLTKISALYPIAV